MQGRAYVLPVAHLFCTRKVFAMQRYAICATLFLSPILASCGSDSSGAASSLDGCNADNAQLVTNVNVLDDYFLPTCAKVKAGSSLTFVNKGSIAHTVSSDAGAPNTFDEETFDPGDVVTIPFSQKGATGVHCNIHAQMKLSVIVE